MGVVWTEFSKGNGKTGNQISIVQAAVFVVPGQNVRVLFQSFKFPMKRFDEKVVIDQWQLGCLQLISNILPGGATATKSKTAKLGYTLWVGWVVYPLAIRSTLAILQVARRKHKVAFTLVDVT